MKIVVKRTLCGEIANNTGSNAKDNASPRGKEAGSGSSSNQARDGAGTPADHRPLASQAPIEDNPSDGREHGGQVGVPACNDGAEVGTESRSSVEAQPAEPQQDSSKGDERDVVRAEVEHHLLLAASQNHGVCESRQTGNDFDRTSTSIVEHSPLESPSVNVPHPACDRAVYDSGPAEDENHHGNQASAFGDTSDDNGSGDGAELHLSSSLVKVRAIKKPPFIPGRRHRGVQESMDCPG